MNKVALTMIVGEFEPLNIILRSIDSIAKHIDGIYITITHSSDEASDKAKELSSAIKVYCISKGYPEPDISFFKWIKDFSAARNYNMTQVDPKYDWIFWLDCDDVVRNAKDIKTAIDNANNKKCDAIFLNYLYQVELTENLDVKEVIIEHKRERIIRNNGIYHWVAKIHETLVPMAPVNQTDTEQVDILHLSNSERTNTSILRNIEILEDELNGQGQNRDPRTIVYLAKAYFDLRTNESYLKAKKLFEDYLNGSTTNVPSGWDEERGQAWDYLAEIYRELGLINNTIKCLHNALIEDPKFPQFYINLALAYCHKQDWKKAEFWVKLSQKIEYPKTTLVMNPRDMKARVLEVLYNIAINTDRIDELWAISLKLSELFPNDEGIKSRLHIAADIKLANDAGKNILAVANYLEKFGYKDKLISLAQSIPPELAESPLLSQFRNDVLPPKEWESNEIAIMCGRGFEKWSPLSLTKGVGGSEEAVIYISKELAKLGWKVTVYGDPQDEAGEYDGVVYKHYFEFNVKDHFNILIGWRAITLFDTKFNARKKYLWLHDVANTLEYTKERVDNIDKIFVLSEAHKKTVMSSYNKEWLTDDKFFMTSNGIHLDYFNIKKKKLGVRDNKRVVYGSSYDRGLEHLLSIWPEVKRQVPEATLHVYYGWNLFESFYRNNPERMAWKEKISKAMEYDGVFHHGRVGQDEIIADTFKSGIWAYPTHFYEISCINAMKAQAAGAIPVVTDYAALKETVQFGTKISVEDEDIYDNSKKLEFKNALIKALKDDTWQESIRNKMMKWARETYSWEKVALNWSNLFRNS